MSDADGNGASFNRQVEATRFAGDTVARLDRVEGDVREIRDDVRWLRNHVQPIAFIVGGIPTVIAIVALWQSFQAAVAK